MCFNPSPVRRVPSPNRYIAVAKFCFCKNNKRLIDCWLVSADAWVHAPCAIQQQATVMVLLDASAIARNVGRDLVFAASRRAACSHSDLGCANYGAEALPV